MGGRISFLTSCIKLEKSAKESNNDLIWAHTVNVYNRFILAQEIDYTAYEFNIQQEESHKKLFFNHISIALNAFSKFLSVSHYKEAYQALCNSIELLDIYHGKYQYTIDGIDRNQLLDTKIDMEISLGLEPYVFQLSPLIQSKKTKGNGSRSNDSSLLKEKTDDEIITLAKYILSALQLPMDRLSNILHELKATRLFFQRCTDGSLSMFHVKDEKNIFQNSYLKPTVFVLMSNITGLKSSESSDIEKLLKEWNL